MTIVNLSERRDLIKGTRVYSLYVNIWQLSPQEQVKFPDLKSLISLIFGIEDDRPIDVIYKLMLNDQSMPLLASPGRTASYIDSVVGVGVCNFRNMVGSHPLIHLRCPLFGLNQTRLRQSLGLTQDQWYKYEFGVEIMNPDMLDRISRFWPKFCHK